MASVLKRYVPRTLFGRAVLIIVLPLILVQLVALFGFYDRVWNTVTRRMAQALAGDVAMAVQSWVAEKDDEEGKRAVIFNASTALWLNVEFKPGAKLERPTVDDGSGLLEGHLARALRERVPRPFFLDVWNQPRDVVVEVQLDDGVMLLRAPRDRVYTTTPYVMILWMVGGSLIFIAIASIFMRNQVRPIRRLAFAAEEFGKGRDVDGYRPGGAAEVRQAGGAFIVMRERIRRFLAQRTEMLAGIGHDLRTPLTRMKLELALLGDSPSVGGLRADVADMERMVESYLAFVRGEGEESPEPTDLAAMLGELAVEARKETPSTRLVTDGDLVVPLRPQAIKRSLRNLIANAARHGARIDIRARRRERSVKITIDDDGPGIPPQAREDVFKPFFRLDASRNAATGGVGLGLTIARDVVRAHGGEIWLEDSPLGGLRARIKLPV